MNIYDQIYNEKLDSLLKDVMFPKDKMAIHFANDLNHALQYYTAEMLQISLSEYRRLYEYLYGNTFVTPMPILFIGIKAIQGLTPSQWTNCDGDKINHYLYINQVYSDIAEQWNTIASPYMEQARKFAEDKARRDKRELEAKNRLVNLNGRPAHAK